MGFYLLNISVDTADPYPEYFPEDLSFNDQESIIEIIVEQVLGFTDAIQEYDDHDREDHTQKKNGKISFLAQVVKANNSALIQPLERDNRFPDGTIRLTSGFKQIDSPPPKI